MAYFEYFNVEILLFHQRYIKNVVPNLGLRLNMSIAKQTTCFSDGLAEHSVPSNGTKLMN